MRSGIAQKLSTTYIIIIASMLVSGLFCFYVLDRNIRAEKEMQFVILPSLEHLNGVQQLNKEVRKLANTRVFIANNRDQERLSRIVDVDYPDLAAKILYDQSLWQDLSDARLFNDIGDLNFKIYSSAANINKLLSSQDAYLDDSVVDLASVANDSIAKNVGTNEKILVRLITAINAHLELEQSSITTLQRYLYAIIFTTILLVMAVAAFSLSYSQKQVINPLFNLRNTILNLAVGRINDVGATTRSDEIGQMHNAVNKMIGSIKEKISFSQEIGSGNYQASLSLLSSDDALGEALIKMRADLRQINSELKEKETRLLEAQKMAKVGDFYLDLKTNRFECSSIVDEILGLNAKFDKTLANWRYLIAPEWREFVQRTSTQAKNDKTPFGQNFRILRAEDGSERWVEVIGERVYDNDQNPIAVFGTVQDVTQSKHMELELNQSYKVATEQNKRLLNFSHIVSHNLRMHAVNIDSLLNLIDETDNSEEIEDYYKMLKTASGMLNETMHHLNDVVAMQSAAEVETKPLLLNDHINNALAVLGTKITEKDAIIENLVSDDIVIHFNPAYLDSIILNFISNGIKYSHPDRQPHVVVSCVPIGNPRGAERWMLTIKDNGIGIDLAKHGSKLFGMYKTFHGNRDAKGIGLFLTKYQIESMGGTVEVESTVGEGTTFRIFIR